MYTLAIATHTLAALAALAAGILVLWKNRGVRVHALAITAMTATLAVAMTLGWSDRYESATRIIFSGLAVLAAVMTYIAIRTVRRTTGGPGSPTVETVDAIGFNVISLVTAGVIVPVVNMGAGIIGTAVAIVVSVVGTRTLVHRRRRQVSADAAASTFPDRTRPPAVT